MRKSGKIAIALIRVIEVLAKFALYKVLREDYISEIYFETAIDLEEHFFRIISNNSNKEQKYFSIKEDKKISNFIGYDNYQIGIKLQIESSRIIKKGNQNKNSLEDNTNIIKYLKDGYIHTSLHNFISLIQTR